MTSKIVQLHQPCPNCPSSDAYCEYDDGHGFCFSCNYYKAPDTVGVEATCTYEYLPTRGLTKETLKVYDIRTKIDGEGKPLSLGFPYPNGAVKVRSLSSKEFFWAPGTAAVPGLFGVDKFAAGASKFITITEGELDAASIYQATGTPCVSVRSASSGFNDVSVLRSWFDGYETVVLAFDNDTAGKELTAKVARLFEPDKLRHCKFTNRKDANEYLQEGEENTLRRLWWAAKPYKPDTIVSGLDEFRSELFKPKPVGIPYPFPTLTRMTYGIRTGETVLFKAPEKVGKTALMRTILHSILKGTEDNVGAIFIEEPKQRLLQGLAGLELQKPVHLPDCDASDDDIWRATEAVVKADDRLHIYSHFGTSDPDVLLDTVRFLVSARGCRYIVFDHISMAVTGLAGEKDERRALEYLASRLEILVKELDFALIMVSHVNDAGQTRGSHYLTKVADITVDCQRNTLALDEEERRTIYLSIPYNRFCSCTGPAGRIVFNQSTYVLTEKQEEGANDNARPNLNQAA